MPLTPRMERMWASAPVGEVGRTGLSLTHSRFSRDWHLTSSPTAFDGETSFGVVTFQPHPFEVERPELSAAGKADLKLSLFNSGAEFSSEILAAASLPDEAIRVEVNDYLPDDQQSQIEAIILSLGKLAVTTQSCTGTATSVDFLNLPYPRGVYRSSLFRGLVR